MQIYETPNTDHTLVCHWFLEYVQGNFNLGICGTVLRTLPPIGHKMAFCPLAVLAISPNGS